MSRPLARSSRSESLLSARLKALSRKKKRRVELVLCPHCSQMLAPKTFKKHKRLYYLSQENTWISESGDTEVEGDLVLNNSRILQLLHSKVHLLERCSKDSAPAMPLDQMDCEDTAQELVLVDQEEALSVESSDSSSSGTYLLAYLYSYYGYPTIG